MYTALNEKATKILAEHQVPALDDGVLATINAVLARRGVSPVNGASRANEMAAIMEVSS